LDSFASQARFVHVEIDPSELGKNRRPDVALLGDARAVLQALLERMRYDGRPRMAWLERVAAMKSQFAAQVPLIVQGHLSAQHVVRELGRASPHDAVVVAGVGQHQMWAALHFGFRATHTWLTSGGLGAMGYALPAAIGAQATAPERAVVVIDGDGCFHMTSNELATAVHHRLPLKVFILNNGNMGMVRQWVDLFHDGRQVATDNAHLPSFARLAEAYGARGLEASTPEELARAIAEAFRHTGGPVVVDVRVAPHEDVYPMVPPGRSNSEFLLGAVKR
jgi:acetolactate synthase-1/2/3 large subunit